MSTIQDLINRGEYLPMPENVRLEFERMYVKPKEKKTDSLVKDFATGMIAGIFSAIPGAIAGTASYFWASRTITPIKDELGGFATLEEAVRACERGEGEHVTMNQSNIHTCRFKIKNFIKKIPLFKLQTCTPTQGRVDDKLALGGIAVLAGTLICLIPHPVAQVVGGALIVSGLGTGGTALLDQSEINEVLQGAQ